jgi:type IV pilus assembly protein PilQ
VPVVGGRTGQRTASCRRAAAVIFEVRTNQLFVTDIPSKLEEIRALIAKIDIPVRQVLIEARIVEADDTFGRALGVKLGATDLRGLRGGTPGWSAATTASAPRTTTLWAATGQTLQGRPVDFADTPSSTCRPTPAALNGAAAATFALSLFGASANRFLNLELSALEAEGAARSSPARASSPPTSKEALIEQGEELPTRPPPPAARRDPVQARRACGWR